MDWLRNLNLGTKFTLILLLAIGIFSALILALSALSTRNLINEVGQLRIQQEILVLQEQINSAQEELSTAATLMTNTPGFVSAVADNNITAIQTMVLTTLPSLEFTEIDIINADGEYLLTLADESADVDEVGEASAIQQTLYGIRLLTILSEQTDDGISLELVFIQPIRDTNSDVVGGLLMSRKLDNEFLSDINLERTGIDLSLVFNNQVVAESQVLNAEDAEIGSAFSVNPDFLSQAMRGEIVINPDIVRSDSGVPYSEAYIPLAGETDNSPQATLIIHVANEEIASFQQNIFTTIGATLVILAVSVAILGAVLAYFTITRRTRQLQTASLAIAQGDYARRADVGSRDELGQLAQSINTMASAVQQREGQLSELNTALEQRVIEAQEAQHRAEQSDNVKSAFLASMSHELRTPLNAIINFSKFVAKGVMGPVNERQEETLHKVIDSGQHLLNLINDVLDISKIESGSLKLFVEENIQVGDLVKRAIDQTTTLLEDKPVRVEYDIAHNLPRMAVDQKRIYQIVLNMLSNACKFTMEGTIKIRAYMQDGEIIVSVTDTGLGIAEQDYADVFEVFKQTTTGLSQGGGSGLGMPISKRLAEAHGGRVWFESVVNKGSTFYVALPVNEKITELSADIVL